MKSKINLLLWFALICLVFISLYFILSRNNQDIVYVDINKLVEGYYRTEIEQTSFEKKAAHLSANRDSLVNDWKNEIKQYEKECSKMSKRELALQQELLTNKQQQINQYHQVIEQQIQTENEKTRQLIMKDINSYIQKFGEKQPYPIILLACMA